jgi:UPF0755 protein
MTENGNTWPPNRRDPRLSQPPSASQGFQPPQPLHHDPRDRDPRLTDPRRAADSPWRRTQQRSRPQNPESTGWYPAQARHGAGPGGGGETPYGGPEEPYGQPYSQPSEEDDLDDRFLPGFGNYGDEDDEDDEDGGDGGDDRDDQPRRGRAARRAPVSPRGPKGPRRPRRRRLRWIAPLAALLVILIPLAIGGSYLYSFYQSKYHPADFSGPGTGTLVVQVPSGATPTSLGPELVKLGVVASARAFVLAAEHSSNPNGLLPGFYGVHEHMQASLAYALLLNPNNLVEVKVTIPEGWRLSQIVAYLGAKSGIPASNYQKVLANPAELHLPAYANGKPEGYLFPATYEVVPHETALGVLTAMVQRFEQQAAQVSLPTAAKQVHLSQGQVIIMASLVEAEGGKTSDYPKIARVIYNRLAQHIALQLDSTVLYGLNTYGIIANDQQLTSSSPYNTYKYKGLTPGPIDSPGAAAIQAVLNPAAGNWIYFVTVNPKTKETLFTASQAQFEQYRAELEHNLGQG